MPPWPSVAFLSPGLRAAPLPPGSCLLQLSDLSLTATGFNTLGEVVLPVPGDPALRGARLFVQLVTEARGGHASFGPLGMSGDASRVVSSSFRIARQRIGRLEERAGAFDRARLLWFRLEQPAREVILQHLDPADPGRRTSVYVIHRSLVGNGLGRFRDGPVGACPS